MSRDHAKEQTTKRDAVLGMLHDGQWHTVRDMLREGGVRYGARILELRRLGWKIEGRDSGAHGGKEYRLGSTRKGAPQVKRVKVLFDEADAEHLRVHGTMTPSARIALTESLVSYRANKDKL